MENRSTYIQPDFQIFKTVRIPAENCRKRGLLISLIFSLFSSVIFGQTSEKVTLEVVDQNLKPIANAELKLLNSSFSSRTSSGGYAYFLKIPYGTYQLIAQKEGYASAIEFININENMEEFSIQLSNSMEKLDEVIVTAQKTEENIQEIPISISTLSSGEIQISQIQQTNDLTARIPNLFASDPGDRRTVTSIRGLVSTSYDPAIATYVDGVNQFNLDTYISKLYDVERIEILRGPQSTLFGRNAMGGVINIETKKFTSKREIFADLNFSNYDFRQFSAGTRLPLIGDRLFFGIAGQYEESTGFYTNRFDNSSYDSTSNFSVNSFLKYVVNSAWEFTLNFKSFSSRNEGAFPLVMNSPELFDDPYTVNQNQVSAMKDQTINASLVLRHFSKINFTSQTAFQNNYRYYEDPLDADFSPIDGISIFNNYGSDFNNVKVFTQELQFSSPTREESNFNWIAGAYAYHQTSPTRQATRFGSDAQLVGAETPNFELVSTNKDTNYGVAVFGQSTFALSEKVEITGGVRYDYEKKEKSVLGEYYNLIETEPLFEFQPDTTANAGFDAFSPKLGISFKLKDNQNLYVQYSRGFRAGGLTALGSDPSQPPLYTYAPEFSNNYELGSKNNFLKDKLKINATLFYTEVNDVQVPALILPDAIVITRNTGKLRSKGIEIETDFLPVKGVRMGADFGYTHAVYENLKLPGGASEIDFRNNSQIFTPEYTGLFSLQYDSKLKLFKTFDYYLRAEWKAIGRQYFDLANTIEQKPYSIYNGFAGISHSNWNLSFYAKNILNEKYISFGYDFGAVQLGNPVRYGLALSVVL